MLRCSLNKSPHKLTYMKKILLFLAIAIIATSCTTGRWIGGNKPLQDLRKSIAQEKQQQKIFHCEIGFRVVLNIANGKDIRLHGLWKHLRVSA